MQRQAPPRSESPEHTGWHLFGRWAAIGLQSFGGGTTALLMVRRTFVSRPGGLTAAEFQLDLTLSLLSPGINMVALAVLIGRRLGGYAGSLASVLGLLVPSAVITCLLTAGFAAVRDTAVMKAALHGVIPATAALMVAVALQFAMPLLRPYGEIGAGSPLRAAVGAVICVAGAVALVGGQLAAVVVLPVTAVLGTLTCRPRE